MENYLLCSNNDHDDNDVLLPACSFPCYSANILQMLFVSITVPYCCSTVDVADNLLLLLLIIVVVVLIAALDGRWFILVLTVVSNFCFQTQSSGQAIKVLVSVVPLFKNNTEYTHVSNRLLYRMLLLLYVHCIDQVLLYKAFDSFALLIFRPNCLFPN